MRSFIYLVIIFFDCASIAGAVWLGHPAQEYFEEERFITWLSCIHLAVAAGISLCNLIALSHRDSRTRNTWRQIWFWGLCCIGFFYLATDEWYMIHENLDFWIHHILHMKETSLTDRIDDLIVLLYGVLFCLGCRIFYKDFWDHKVMVRWLVAGLSLFLLMSLLDFVTNDYYLYQFFTDNRGLDEEIGMILGTLEDSLKLLSEGVLVIALLEGFHATLKDSAKRPLPNGLPGASG